MGRRDAVPTAGGSPALHSSSNVSFSTSRLRIFRSLQINTPTLSHKTRQGWGTPHRVASASGTGDVMASAAATRFRKIAEPRYRIAARIVNDFSPNHNEADSRRPPIRAPKRFDPRALPRNPARAKLETKMMPAKNTGVHRTSVASSARRDHDS